ncbi:MAG: hypothetical protein Q7T11_00895 [Deltaproteobacteria bacterium]|nr:hypothetical protein [Deltaproteobacteria bacterium]
MKIKKVQVNNSKKCLEVATTKAKWALPFAKLRLIPTPENRIKTIYVDKELGNEGITYTLESGEEDSVPLDAFLDYNREPEYMRKALLHNLTCFALEYIEKSGLSKREIARKMSTSPAQLYRLLNTANYAKTIDQMAKLLYCLGYDLELKTRPSSHDRLTHSHP